MVKKKDLSHHRQRSSSRRRRRPESCNSGGKSRSSPSCCRGSNNRSRSYLTWKEQSRNRKISPSALRALEQRRFKATGELLASAASHLGALNGYFLALVHQMLCQGPVLENRQLHKANVNQWVAGHAGLAEKRDVRFQAVDWAETKHPELAVLGVSTMPCGMLELTQ